MKSLFALLASLLFATCAVAHEVQPAIGDIAVIDGRLELDLVLNGEVLVADSNIDGVDNTDALENSDELDALRRLEPAALHARLEDRLPAFIEDMNLQIDAASVDVTWTTIEVGLVGNPELPRDTTLSLSAMVPDGAGTFNLTWPTGMGALVLRQQGAEDPYTGFLNGGDSTGPVAIGGGDAAGGWQTFATYIPVGFDHILPKGLDHILFVLGLFFLSAHLMPLLWQVTSFTVAHSVTLAMAVLGVVSVPASIVEPLIAASIVYVAVENILSKGLSPWRPFMIFAFGLLHGLGFASVLGEFGLPQGQVIPALIGFNLGVEIGQLTVIALAYVLVYMALRVDQGEGHVAPAQGVYAVLAVIFVGIGFATDTEGFRAVMGASGMVFFWPLAALSGLCILSVTFVDQLESYRRYVAMPASATIALVGAYWFIERVFL